MKPKCFPQFPLQKRRFSRPVRQCLRTLALEAARLLWAVSTVAWKVVLQSKWHFEVTATEIWMVVRPHHNLLTHHLCCIFAWKQNEKFWEILSWLAHVKRHWQACKAGDFSNHRMKLFFFLFFCEIPGPRKQTHKYGTWEIKPSWTIINRKFSAAVNLTGISYLFCVRN